MEAIEKLAEKTLTRASSAISLVERPPESSPIGRPARQRPLANDWQRKWLDMEVTHPDVQKLANAAQVFAKAWFARKQGNRWRVVTGSVGTGKSRVARRLDKWFAASAYTAWEGWKDGSSRLPSIVFIEWSQVGSTDTCDQRDWDFFVADVEHASVVIIDDVGVETDRFRSSIPTERLCHVLNRCDGKFLWLNTNLAPQEWATRWDARVEDRLLAGQIIEVNAPSYRSER